MMGGCYPSLVGCPVRFAADRWVIGQWMFGWSQNYHAAMLTRLDNQPILSDRNRANLRGKPGDRETSELRVSPVERYRLERIMGQKHKILWSVGATLLAIPLALMMAERVAPAADHLDPPTRTDPAMDATPDVPADIADVYAWYTNTSVIVVMTFAGPQATSQPAVYDRDVLYTINISNGPTKFIPTIPIKFRFGQDSARGANQYGVQVTGLPGVTGGTITGPVETDLTRDGVTVRAGLFDDPFFFDLQGFRTSRSTGTLSFSSTRNFFAGQNLTAVVIEIPKDRIANGSNPIGIWGTTARFGGQL